MIREQNQKKLLKELEGVELTERETSFISWLAGYDRRTTNDIIGIFKKLREKR